MTAPTAIPADAVWGVQWEVPILPANDPSVPPQPQQPDAPGGDPAWGPYNDAISQWYQDILDLANMHEEWWKPTVSQFPDEPTARDMYGKLKANHDATPFARGTTLVWSNPTVWTPVA